MIHFRTYISDNMSIILFHPTKISNSKEEMAKKLCDLVWENIVSNYMDEYFKCHHNIVYTVEYKENDNQTFSFKVYCYYKDSILHLKFVSSKNSEECFPSNDYDILLIKEQFEKERIDIKQVCLNINDQYINVTIDLKPINIKKAPKLPQKKSKSLVRTRMNTINRIISR